jgi:hypothetical protein
MGNILALRAWYKQVRVRFVRDAFDERVLRGGIENLELILAERVKRLGDLADKMSYSIQCLERVDGMEALVREQRAFQLAWQKIKAEVLRLELQEKFQGLENFAVKVPKIGSYIETIQGLEDGVRSEGVSALEAIVNEVVNLWRAE